MKLQQLRYLAAIVEADFNISAAANKLHLSQPGVSRQLKLLEDELGFELFVRDGRALERLTPAGQRVLERAQRALRETQAIKSMSLDARDAQRGSLSIATTHTQARYVLPPVIGEYSERYPDNRLRILDVHANEAMQTVLRGEAEFGITLSGGGERDVETEPLFDELWRHFARPEAWRPPAAAAGAAPAAVFLGSGLVHRQGTAVDLVPIESGDRSLQAFVGFHLDETETA